ncbi:hypothetical protein ABKA04_007322 [Annulohypoxylon sp. FPYF3050]
MSLRQVYPDPKNKAIEPADKLPKISPEIDIIAVHGLGSPNMDGETNARVTWGTSSEEDRHMWLRDELPRDFPNSRVFLYEYDAITAYGKNKETFLEKANELLKTVRIKRDGVESRPIMFLGHSIGGFLIQQALINAINIPKYGTIESAAPCLAFFATPLSITSSVNWGPQYVGELAAELAIAAGFPDGSDVMTT